jgi:hypothetical protein
MRPLLTLALAVVVVSMALLAALAVPARAGPVAAHPVRVFALADPEICPARTGYTFVSVARDPAIYRYADQNTDGVVCVRIASARIPSLTTVLIDDLGGSSGDPNSCPAPFVPISLERLPNREMADDARLVDRDGNGLVCLYQTAGRSSIVVIDNVMGTLNG